jgi:hypothetical protein
LFNHRLHDSKIQMTQDTEVRAARARAPEPSLAGSGISASFTCGWLRGETAHRKICTIFAPRDAEQRRKPPAYQGFSMAVPVGFEPDPSAAAIEPLRQECGSIF